MRQLHVSRLGGEAKVDDRILSFDSSGIDFGLTGPSSVVRCSTEAFSRQMLASLRLFLSTQPLRTK